MLLATRAQLGALVLLALACAPTRPAEDGRPPIATGSAHRPAPGAYPERQATGPPSPATRAPLAVEHGKATYYSDRLAGRSTASGEPYAPARLTAAHKKLPFGTLVRVVRVDTGHRVEVVINDRGPFAGAERIIDVSGAAAKQLDMLRAGGVPVRVEILKYGSGRRQR
ncbi:MAG TPA: septal ring lytic transglycosylase RlpA family protein [Polyangiaceae bacterium]|nr:septal ring lytic transglycosylase RlpA family protein [Polyangiaceae bacterium]